MRLRIRIDGVVQGVGFRPFVRRLASRHTLAGFVRNDDQGVFIEAEGDEASLAPFVHALRAEAPPLASIETVDVANVAPVGGRVFDILDSRRTGDHRAHVAPDTATCTDCIAELFDPANRRYRHPFINCTNCGPRYTIVRDVPYDRANTTMAPFAMCSECAREYHDPDDRRYHAQPVCCPACGPSLWFEQPAGSRLDGDAVTHAAAALRAGLIVSVKGLGAYHLAVLARDADAVARLRARKRREERPFALMVRDLGMARRLCFLDADEARSLEDRRASIVLAARHENAPVAAGVAPGNRSFGLLLPYTPLHHLLLGSLDEPIVLTSANVSDEPVAFDDTDARERLATIADAFVTHDRAIHVRADDSVLRVVGGRTTVLRRSRGHVPAPVRLPIPAIRPILACGGELKNTVCVAKHRDAFVSHHIGDLENYATYRAFLDAITHLCRLFDTAPAVVAHDLHPEYLSTKHALALDDVELIGVQHHHAHLASCLADNGEAGPVLGVAFDGLGYGCDRSLWGGEVLLADLRGYRRVAHLAPVALPGGVRAIREPWRMAASYLHEWALPLPDACRDLPRRHGERWRAVTALCEREQLALRTTSAGRLFDAVAAILGVRDVITYEGQAAIELEQLADPDESGAYEAGTRPGTCVELDGVGLVGQAVEDLAAGTDRARVAARFHNGLVDLVARGLTAAQVATPKGPDTVALSGGVFQNAMFTARLVERLTDDGWRVLTHHRVPPNDGGLSLGQAAVAAARTAPATASSAEE